MDVTTIVVLMSRLAVYLQSGSSTMGRAAIAGSFDAVASEQTPAKLRKCISNLSTKIEARRKLELEAKCTPIPNASCMLRSATQNVKDETLHNAKFGIGLARSCGPTMTIPRGDA